MVSYCHNSNSSLESGCVTMLDPFSHSLGGFNEVLRGGTMASQASVMESEKVELVKAPARVGKKGMSEAKALAALKSHSEAERRRRERINVHLDTLRSLVPFTGKMDKATLLAEVITQVKELKKKAIEASRGHLVPLDDNEVKVEPYNDGAGDEALHFKASLCCDYRPGILSDLRQAIEALPLKLVNAEISTLGGRLKNELVFTRCRNKYVVDIDDAEARQALANSIHQILSSAMEKGCSSPEYSPRTTLPSKRRRVTFFDSSSSSS